MDLAGTDLNDVIAEFLDDRLSGENRDETIAGADRIFFADILRAVLRRQREIDPMIDEQLAIGWRLGARRFNSCGRSCAAAWPNFSTAPDVPARVAINEYVNVAHFFFDQDEPRVVNGVLDKIARKVRGHEFDGRRVTPS